MHFLEMNKFCALSFTMQRGATKTADKQFHEAKKGVFEENCPFQNYKDFSLRNLNTRTFICLFTYSWTRILKKN